MPQFSFDVFYFETQGWHLLTMTPLHLLSINSYKLVSLINIKGNNIGVVIILDLALLEKLVSADALVCHPRVLSTPFGVSIANTPVYCGI